jgi:hypothetical protein
MLVEVGSGEPGIDGVDAHGRERGRVLDGQHVERGQHNRPGGKPISQHITLPPRSAA